MMVKTIMYLFIVVDRDASRSEVALKSWVCQFISLFKGGSTTHPISQALKLLGPLRNPSQQPLLSPLLKLGKYPPILPQRLVLYRIVWQDRSHVKASPEEALLEEAFGVHFLQVPARLPDRVGEHT